MARKQLRSKRTFFAVPARDVEPVLRAGLCAGGGLCASIAPCDNDLGRSYPRTFAPRAADPPIDQLMWRRSLRPHRQGRSAPSLRPRARRGLASIPGEGWQVARAAACADRDGTALSGGLANGKFRYELSFWLQDLARWSWRSCGYLRARWLDPSERKACLR